MSRLLASSGLVKHKGSRSSTARLTYATGLGKSESKRSEKNSVKETGRKDCTYYGRLARNWCCNRQASGCGRSERGHHIHERCRCGCVGRQGDRRRWPKGDRNSGGRR